MFFAAMTGLAMAWRLVQLEQPFMDRTLLLVVLAIMSGAFSALIILGFSRIVMRGFWPKPRVVFLFLSLPSAYGSIFLLLFGVHYRFILGQWDPEESDTTSLAFEIFVLVHDTLGLFVATGLKFFLGFPGCFVLLAALPVILWHEQNS
jgi:hypothetical protein